MKRIKRGKIPKVEHPYKEKEIAVARIDDSLSHLRSFISRGGDVENAAIFAIAADILTVLENAPTFDETRYEKWVFTLYPVRSNTLFSRDFLWWIGEYVRTGYQPIAAVAKALRNLYDDATQETKQDADRIAIKLLSALEGKAFFDALETYIEEYFPSDEFKAANLWIEVAHQCRGRKEVLLLLALEKQVGLLRAKWRASERNKHCISQLENAAASLIMTISATPSGFAAFVARVCSLEEPMGVEKRVFEDKVLATLSVEQQKAALVELRAALMRKDIAELAQSEALFERQKFLRAAIAFLIVQLKHQSELEVSDATLVELLISYKTSGEIEGCWSNELLHVISASTSARNVLFEQMINDLPIEQMFKDLRAIAQGYWEFDRGLATDWMTEENLLREILVVARVLFDSDKTASEDHASFVANCLKWYEKSSVKSVKEEINLALAMLVRRKRLADPACDTNGAAEHLARVFLCENQLDALKIVKETIIPELIKAVNQLKSVEDLDWKSSKADWIDVLAKAGVSGNKIHEVLL